MTSKPHSIAEHRNWWHKHILNDLSPAIRIQVLEDLKAHNILQLAQLDQERDVLLTKIEDLSRQITDLQRAS